MTESRTENPVLQDTNLIPQDGKPIATLQRELVAQVDSYNILRDLKGITSAMYNIQNTTGEQDFLHIGSYGAKGGNQSYYCAYWDGVGPIDGFLNQTDGFFTHYSDVDPVETNKLLVCISGDKGMLQYVGERPITTADLVEVERESIGDEAERLKLLRVENNIGVFTWEPDRVSFIIVPSVFPDQEALRGSLREVYEASNPSVPTTVFERALEIVSTDEFQLPQIR